MAEHVPTETLGLPRRSDRSARAMPEAAELFRLGRLGMGWTQETLAQTVFAPVETVREWESGARLIPPKVIAFVSLYARQGEIGAATDAGQLDLIAAP